MDFDVVPYEDIIWGERIGGGSFGSVFKGQYLGIDIAIKEIHMSNEYDVHKYFEREWRIMRECRHPNIALFLGLSKEIEDDGRVFIVSEYVPRGNLRSFIRSKAPFPWSLRISFATDVARAVAYLHARQCLHRDLKGENLLITSNDRIKVTDFGFARITGRNAEEMRHMTYCGTDGYMSPEIIMGEPFDLPTDVYSLGIIFIEILTRILVGSKVYSRKAPLFIPDSDIVRRRASPGCPPAFVDLAIECCRFSPDERPKMPDVLARLRRIEEVLPDEVEDTLNVGSIKMRREGKRPMPIFQTSSLQSEIAAAAAVESELGDHEDMDDMVDAPVRTEGEDLAAIARVDITVDGTGPSTSIPWDEVMSDFAPVSGDKENEPLFDASSELSWRTAGIRAPTALPVAADNLCKTASPARMPCAYPPSPPYDRDEPVGSTFTIRGQQSHGASQDEEMEVSEALPEAALGDNEVNLPTPQPSEGGESPKGSTRSLSRSKLTHRFSILHREQHILSMAASLAFAFLPRPGAKDKCVACSRRLGSARVVLQCDDCGALVHTKCSATVPRNCHADATRTAASALGVDP